MKRVVLFAFVVFAAVICIQAQNGVKNSAPLSSATRTVPLSPGAIRVENDGDALAFFLVLPMAPAEVSTFLSRSSRVVEEIQSKLPNFDYLAAGAVAAEISVGETDQVVIGFTVVPGSASWPVWYLRIPPVDKRSSAPWFSLSSASPLLDGQRKPVLVRSADFDLPAHAIRIDGRFVDWLKFDSLLVFDETIQPLLTLQVNQTETKKINSTEALSFHKAGTDLEQINMIRDGKEAFLHLSSRTLMAPGLSYMIRLYNSSSQIQNKYTIELALDAATGPVLLWTSGNRYPQVIGTYATADHNLEARFQVSTATQTLATLFNQDWQLEFSSLWSKSGLSEEFIWGRLAANRAHTLANK